MAHVFRSGVINAPADAVWEIVGNFDGLPEWNPPIESSTPESIDNLQHRRLAFSKGGAFLERNMGTDGRSIGYRIIETNAPIEGYLGTISVIDQGDTCILCWSSSFDTEEPGMVGAVGDIYQAGIDTIAAKFA